MKINKLFKKKDLVISFEIFPSKPTTSMDYIFRTLDGVAQLKPSYISVSYEEKSYLTNERTCEVSSMIKNKYGIETLAHLNCVQGDKAYISKVLENISNNNVENILAVRGDLSFKECVLESDFRYASDLIEVLNKKNEFSIGAIFYLANKFDNESINENLDIMKIKIDKGASHFISRVIFNNNDFYNYMNKFEQRQFKVPIQATIIPLVDANDIRLLGPRYMDLLPEKTRKIMEKYKNNPIALREAGIAYALYQIKELINCGVDGIHLFIGEDPSIAVDLMNGINLILNSCKTKEITKLREVFYE